ncbi:MAG: hypothetical protein PF637_01850 [Spirochaetes bacterium]|jgi:hypothetical protein|nr:hypothetical protein [Spirochaetota bacterium]
MSSNESKIRTSISVQLKWRKFLEDYAKNHGLGVSDLINILLDKQMIRMKNSPEGRYGPMKYQPRGLGYKPVHLDLQFAMYSKLKDVMFLFRFTLSFILSLAMESFEELMNPEKRSEFVDSYPENCHSTIVTEVENVTLFANYWGIPPGDHEITIPTG